MKRILFFGELPPETVHGASISSQLNLQMLSCNFDVVKVRELYDIKNHSSGYFKKINSFRMGLHSFIGALRLGKFDYFYGVIYLSTLGSIKNICTVLLFKFFNPKSNVILHFHRSDFVSFNRKPFNRVMFWFLNLFVYRYIILSEKQKLNFRESIGKKCFVLLNAIEIENSSTFCDDKEQVNHNNINILYLGNFIREKGVLDLIQAVKFFNANRHVSLRLDLYGAYASSTIKSEILREITNVDNLFLHESIHGPDKMDLISRSGVLVLPSTNEGLPLVLLEAMSVGTPVIITKVGYITEALGDDYEFYCEVNNPISIVQCIDKLINSRQKAELKESLRNKYKKYNHLAHQKTLSQIFSNEG